MSAPTPFCRQCGARVEVRTVLAPRGRAGIRPSVEVRECTNASCRSTYYNRPERDQA